MYKTDNKVSGETYGIEIFADWNVTNNWKLMPGYSFLNIQLYTDKSTPGVSQETEAYNEGSSPQHKVYIRSHLNLPHNFEFDTAIYYVDSLPFEDLFSYDEVPSYADMDIRVGWNPRENLNLSIVAQNLLNQRHTEFLQSRSIETQIQRRIYGKILWKF